MTTINEVYSTFDTAPGVRLVHGNDGSQVTKRPSILGWFQILRMHYRRPLFEAIRYALWLSR